MARILTKPSDIPTASPVMPAVGGSRTFEEMEEIARGKRPAFPATTAAPSPDQTAKTEE